MQRGAIIIIENGELFLIERVRAGRTYYLFPGGGVESGETVEQAAVREAREELGLDVELGPLVSVVEHDNRQQHYYYATVIGGEFGTGNGEEYNSSADFPDGSYKPVRLRLSDLGDHDVRPQGLAVAIASNSLLYGGEVLCLKD